MFTPLAKLAIGLSATMATAFYYLAAAPPASAQYVCGPGNFSPVCMRRRLSSPSPSPSPSPSASPVIADPVPVVPVVESPAVIPEPVQQVPVVDSPTPIAEPVQQVPVLDSSPVIADPVQEVPIVDSPAVIADPVQQPATEPALTAPAGDLGNIYPPPTTVKPTAIPEPGTVVALLVTGAGLICSGKKRNKQVRQQR